MCLMKPRLRATLIYLKHCWLTLRVPRYRDSLKNNIVIFTAKFSLPRSRALEWRAYVKIKQDRTQPVITASTMLSRGNKENCYILSTHFLLKSSQSYVPNWRENSHLTAEIPRSLWIQKGRVTYWPEGKGVWWRQVNQTTPHTRDSKFDFFQMLIDTWCFFF